MLRSVPIFASLLALAPLVSAQGRVLVVDDDGGPGVDHTALSAAVAAAHDGDLVLVRDGVYGGATIVGKGIALVADAAAEVFLTAPLVVRELPLGKRVVVSGLEVEAEIALRVQDCDGAVFLESSRFVGSSGYPLPYERGAAIRFSRDVTFSHCEIRSTSPAWANPGLDAAVSDVHLYECELVGAPGILGLEGGAGCLLQGGSLFASGTSFVGGRGGDGLSTGGGCVAGGDGGDGLWTGPASGDPSVVLLDCELTPGQGGAPSGGTCSPGTNGLPAHRNSGSVRRIAGHARRLEVDRVPRGAALTFELVGESGDFCELVAARTIRTGFDPDVHGVWIPDPQTARTIAHAALDGTGRLELETPRPELPARAEFVMLFVQAVHVDPLGRAFLGSPHLIVLLGS